MTSFFSINNTIKSYLVLFPFWISSTLGLDLDSLPIHESHPDTYTLFMVDTTRLASINEMPWKDHPKFKRIGPRYLRVSLVNNKKISFADSLKKIESNKEEWINIKILASKVKDKQTRQSFVVQLWKRNRLLKAANLMQTMTHNVSVKPSEFLLQGALIFYCYDNTEQAMVYGLGRWDSLLNPDCIMPRWGLRILSCDAVCDPDKVKQLNIMHHRAANPFSRKEMSTKLKKIESFNIVVGAEELDFVRLFPLKQYKTSHLMNGGNFLRFTINHSPSSTVKETYQSLEKIANHFFKLTRDKKLTIHERMREYIDEEVKDKKLIPPLNNLLWNVVKSPDAPTKIFLHPKLWTEQKSKKLLFGKQKSSSVFPAIMKSSDLNAMPVWRGKRAKSPEMVNIGRFLGSVPLEYEDQFYRFDRGGWYSVDSSRFESIKRLLRSQEVKLAQQDIKLPDYIFKDTERSKTGQALDYKEANYNTRITKLINNQEGWQAALLDRLNISLGAGGHLFEFADLLVTSKQEFYIVHVKRAKANALSHHREQVERCADFLSTELNKKNGSRNILLLAAIKDLYQSQSMATTKAKGQRLRLTKGNKFQNILETALKNGLLKTSPIKVILTKYDRGDDELVKSFKSLIFRKMTDKFFNNFPEETAICIDALFDCFEAAYKANKMPTQKGQEQLVEKFFVSAKQAIEAQTIFFEKGLMSKKNHDLIHIVLAVIDDRNIERLLKSIKKIKEKIAGIKGDKNTKEVHLLQQQLEAKEKEKKTLITNSKNKKPLFKNQDLWGLDRTRSLVQSYGFKFNLVVINEDEALEWDAFGAINKKKIWSDPLFNEQDSDSSPKQIKRKYSQTDVKTTSKTSPHCLGQKKPKIVPTSQKIDIDQLFENVPAAEELNLNQIQKLSYGSAPDPNNGIYGDYLLCPTVGDGDCYFHAVFTEDKDNVETVKDKAQQIRAKFCNKVKKNKNGFLNDCKNLLYEHYLKIFSQKRYTDIPSAIEKLFKDKRRHDKFVNNLRLCEMDPDNISHDMVPPSESDIKNLIKEEDIKAFIEKLRTVGGEESYIPVRPGMRCPAELIALMEGRTLNIFTFNETSKSLDLIKSVGTMGPIINVLLAGNHFVRLFNPAEDDSHHRAAEQILMNAQFTETS